MRHTGANWPEEEEEEEEITKGIGYCATICQYVIKVSP